MSKINLYNMDNMEFNLLDGVEADFIYADYIFENDDFSWVDKYWNMLKENGIMAVHSDHKFAYLLKYHFEREMGGEPYFVNEIITYQNWGGRPRNRFGHKHDLIYIYCKGRDWHWDDADVRIPKEMINPSFNPSGRTDTIPTSLWHDLGNFSTTSSERIKMDDGHNIRWQKPLKILRRLIVPFVKSGDIIVDPFMGSGSSGEVAKEMDCLYYGVEWDEKVYGKACERLIG